MNLAIFCTSVIFFAVATSVPIDDDLIGGGTTDCDIFKSDCSFLSYRNNEVSTVSSTNFDQASDDTGAENPSVYLSLDAANRQSSEVVTKSDSTLDPTESWIGFDRSTYNIAGNPQIETKAPTKPTTTYECEHPIDQPPSPPSQSTLDIRESSSDVIECKECTAGHCYLLYIVIAKCRRFPFGCLLCPARGRYCEQAADVSRLPSPANPYGQSWCQRRECVCHGMQERCASL
ncbi:hypothetical protein MMC07_001227 [Pseudocyphellaria aurata]|nr:hypothetical protein [Pseudocyphellaria aurata]